MELDEFYDVVQMSPRGFAKYIRQVADTELQQDYLYVLACASVETVGVVARGLASMLKDIDKRFSSISYKDLATMIFTVLEHECERMGRVFEEYDDYDEESDEGESDEEDGDYPEDEDEDDYDEERP